MALLSRMSLYVWKRVWSGGCRGGARGGPGPSLILDQLEARRAEKIFFFEAGPPYHGVWMTAPLLMGPPLVCNVKFAAAPVYTSK